MKNLIVVVATHGVLKNQWAVRSIRSILNYANNINAACELHTQESRFIKPIGVSQVPEAFEKFDVLRRVDFDKILTLDCDILVRKGTPCFFDTFQNIEMAALDESQVVSQNSWTAQLWGNQTDLLTKLSFPKSDNGIWQYSNTGVVLTTRETRKKLLQVNQSLRRGQRRKIGFNTDQSYLSILAHMSNIAVTDIGLSWNGLAPVMEESSLHNAHFLHFAGNTKDNLIRFGAQPEFW